jgi:hypothetical protein
MTTLRLARDCRILDSHGLESLEKDYRTGGHICQVPYVMGEIFLEFYEQDGVQASNGAGSDRGRTGRGSGGRNSSERSSQDGRSHQSNRTDRGEQSHERDQSDWASRSNPTNGDNSR